MSEVSIQPKPAVIFEFSYDGSSNLIYLGAALPGTATSAALWSIRRLDYTGSNATAILWANGREAFENIWDNRAALAYS